MRAVEAFCGPVRSQRRAASLRAVQLIRRAGFVLKLEQVKRFPAPGADVFKQHLPHALLDSGYGREDLEHLNRLLFHEGEDREPPGLAHVPIRYPAGCVSGCAGASTLGRPSVWGVTPGPWRGPRLPCWR
jgi:hypothetical protein